MNITDITVNNIKKFVYKMVDRLYVKILIYGEISREQARKIAEFVENDVQTVSSRPMIKEVLPHREIKLENSK